VAGQYSEHIAAIRGVCVEEDVVKMEMAQDISKLFGVVVPIGSDSFVHYFNQCSSLFCIVLNR